MNEGSERKNVYQLYNKMAGWFALNRPVELFEKKHLDAVKELIPDKAAILDLGCGNGKPIMEYYIHLGFKVTGVDASEKMLELAKQNFPSEIFLLQDMRNLTLSGKFNAIIAWHSLFHLPASDQQKMFKSFADYLLPDGILLFTSGNERGEAWGLNGGENLFHASLDADEYREILNKNQFEILSHTINDPSCGNATVWLARFNPE